MHRRAPSTAYGLTQQANVLHTFHSPELAALYRDRQVLLATDPTIGQTALHARWSEPVAIGRTRVRIHFSPEPTGSRESVDTIVEAIRAAKSSVLFCLFMPTDKPLRDAAFEAGDRRLMMFGLVNSMARKPPEAGVVPGNAAEEARVEIYHRSRMNRDIFAHGHFRRGTQPNLFWFETDHIPALGRSDHPVWIHHKFVIIDAETSNPVVYSGSANMSRNSLQRNDENLLEIRGNRALAQTYLAEFLRLYEHYRARVRWDRDRAGRSETFQLRKDRSWANAHYTPNTPEYRARIAMAAPSE